MFYLLVECFLYTYFAFSCHCIIELKSAVGQIHHGDKYVLAVEQNKVLIPPNYNKYLAWGYSDLSVRIGNYESEKVLLIIFLSIDITHWYHRTPLVLTIVSFCYHLSGCVQLISNRSAQSNKQTVA